MSLSTDRLAMMLRSSNAETFSTHRPNSVAPASGVSTSAGCTGTQPVRLGDVAGLCCPFELLWTVPVWLAIPDPGCCGAMDRRAAARDGVCSTVLGRFSTAGLCCAGVHG
eukprot:353839-Chlamydomonas_euryale.AAC.57